MAPRLPPLTAEKIAEIKTPARWTQAADTGLALYDGACRALAEAVAVDEILQIRDLARQMEACARVAKNRDAEADAVTLRMRAVRRLGDRGCG